MILSYLGAPGLLGINGLPGTPGFPGSKGLPVKNLSILSHYKSFVFRVNLAHLEIQVFQVDEVNQAHQVGSFFIM
jgi:hypothetical protein